MLITSATFLAQANPNAEHVGTSVLIFVAIACPIISLVLGGAGVWFAARRNPPMGEEIHRTFVPRVEFHSALTRVDARVDVALTEIAAARTQFGKAFGDLERAIGRLEGRLDVMDNHERARARQQGVS